MLYIIFRKFTCTFFWITLLKKVKHEIKRKSIYNDGEYHKNISINRDNTGSPLVNEVSFPNLVSTLNIHQNDVAPPVLPETLAVKGKNVKATHSTKKHYSDSINPKTHHVINESNKEVDKPNTACPLSCTCKWKRGKETVECASKGFQSIPYLKDSGTQVSCCCCEYLSCPFCNRRCSRLSRYLIFIFLVCVTKTTNESSI